MPVPKRVSERLLTGIKRYQPILEQAKNRDVNEADTVTVVKDILADVFGYDKYAEVTSEHAIKGNFCDLAIKLNGEIVCLIEVKAIGTDLRENHVKQAVDYAANQGCDWVLLTNGVSWRVFHVTFGKPIKHDQIILIDFMNLSPRNATDAEVLFVLCKEGFQRSALGEFNSQRQALSRFLLGSILLTDPVLDVIRRELKRVSPDVRIETTQISEVLENEVLKREVLEGEQATEAKKRISRAANKALRQRGGRLQNPSLASGGPLEDDIVDGEANEGEVMNVPEVES